MSPFQTLVEHTADQRTALHRLPVLADLAEGRFTVESYQAFLTNAYHHVRHTVPLMMACGARLPARLSWLQHPLIEYINEGTKFTVGDAMLERIGLTGGIGMDHFDKP